MKSIYTYLFSCFVALVLLLGCKTNKNTFIHRGYHNLTARFNGYYYATESIKEGEEKIRTTYKYDYDRLLPVFLVPSNETAKSTFPEFDKAIKKSSNISANKIEENFGNYIIYGASGILKKVDFYEEENDYISIIKDGAGVGRLFYCKGKSSVLGTMEMIKPQEGINTYYLYCLLSNIDFTKYITGSTIPHIYFKDYSSEICGIPCLEEQTLVANFLSAIDDKTKAVAEALEVTQQWKKGLLQQLFC